MYIYIYVYMSALQKFGFVVGARGACLKRELAACSDLILDLQDGTSIDEQAMVERLKPFEKKFQSFRKPWGPLLSSSCRGSVKQRQPEVKASSSIILWPLEPQGFYPNLKSQTSETTQDPYACRVLLSVVLRPG